jgi:hypothetical protein
MLSKALFAAVSCACALGAAGTAAAAFGPGELTVYGTEASQSLAVDHNQNGQPDPGDVLLIVGPLNDSSSQQIGEWRAAVQFVDPSTLSVSAEFRLLAGALFVAGSFDPNAGPPTALSVFRSKGSFRGLTGKLAVTGTESGNVFTFTLHCAATEHGVRPPRQQHPGACERG